MDQQGPPLRRAPARPDRALLAHHLSATRLAQADVLGHAYEYLIKKFADATNKKAGEFYTPRSVVRLMVNILDPQEGETIYDPACGTGGMLLEAIHHVRENHGDDRTLWGKLFGQEKNLTTSAIARMNLFLHGAEDFQIVRGDTLRNPAFFLGRQPRHVRLRHRQSAVLAGEVGRRGLGQRPVRPQLRRHAAGQERRLRLGAAHGQVDGAEDRPHGRRAAAGRAVPHGRGRQRFGRSFFGMDLLEAVIGLGPNLFYGTGLAACILVLRQRKPKDRKNKVLIVDASKEFKTGRAQNELLPEHVERIHGWYRAYTDVEGIARVVTLDEIAANDYNLNIPRYVEPPPSSGTC